MALLIVVYLSLKWYLGLTDKYGTIGALLISAEIPACAGMTNVHWELQMHW